MEPAAREKLRDPVDRPPDAQTAAATRVLESLAGGGSPGRRHVAALPLDDEDLSDEAVRAVTEGIADRAAGRTHTSDEVKRELGI